MPRLRIAALSDIHGNSRALEAVLDDIRRRGVDRIVNCGDSLYGPLDPSGTAARLRDSPILSIRGNEDRILLKSQIHAKSNPTLDFTRGALDAEDRRWLRSLKPTMTLGDDIFVCHGTLDSDELYLFERVSQYGIQLRTEQVLLNHIKILRQRLILCGHSHVFRHAVLADGTQIVNAGSVGLPAFRDDWPFPHAMESGSPQARYVLIEGGDGRYDVKPVVVDYDWEWAAATAETRGRPDWASWLRTGRATGTNGSDTP